jgi:hypothetical protein
MNPLGKILSAPFGDLIGGVSSIIDKFHTSDAEKMEAQRKLMELERGFTMKMAELDAQNAKTASEVIIAEAKSEGWAARNWRPITMLTFVYIIAHNFIIAPIFSLASLPIPTDLWELLKIGLGGYVFGRSAEKVAVSLAAKKCACKSEPV